MGVRAGDSKEIAAKLAIEEVVHRYCRGMDRMDKALTLSCWHPGGTDDHAPLYSGTAEGFVEWLWPVHGQMSLTRHIVTNIIIDLKDDRAAVESYWTVLLQVEHREKWYDVTGGGRYLDQFECRDGIWAIRHRQSVMDWNRVEPVELTMADFSDPPLVTPNNPEVPVPVPARDESDLSYKILGNLSES